MLWAGSLSEMNWGYDMDPKVIKALEHCFTLSPDKAVEYLKSQDIEITWDWQSQLDVIRQHCFTVAKVESADVLQTFHDELNKALDEGKTYEDFKKSISEILDTAGYSKRADGSAWRLDTIYRTNLQSSFMSGRFKEMEEVKEEFPYWQYVAVMDSRTRPSHAAMNGKTLRADDDFWKTSFAPNGYNCFPGGTLIATPDGWKAIELISTGDYVIGGSGKPRLVRATMRKSYNQHLIRIVTKEGKSILTTPNHRILTLRGWIRAENLKISDVLVNIAEVSGTNKIVIDVNHINTSVGKDTMSLPCNPPTRVATLTFDSKIKDRNKYIYPIRLPIIIMNYIVTKIVKMFNHNQFGFSWSGFIIRMFSFISKIHQGFRKTEFVPHIRLSRRSSHFKLFGFVPLFFRVFFSLSLPIIRNRFSRFNHFLSSLFPSFRVVEPLCFNGIGTMPNSNIVLFEHTENSSIVHAPPVAQLPDSHFVHNIENGEGFSDGMPLNSFDSLDSFRLYASSHLTLSTVDKIDITNINKYIDIYNLDINIDESYVTEIAIVHNCRCVIRALDEEQVKSKGLKVSKGENINFTPDDGFAANPVETWEPDLTKYSPDIRKLLSKALK